MNKSSALLDVASPVRKKHAYVQSLRGTPSEVFPLLCPVRERDWVPGWNPDWVRTNSGVAENGCVFQTPAHPAPAIWVITRHDAANHRVEMIKVTPGHTVGKLEISLEADGSGGTRANVAYEFTAIGPDGAQFLEEFTEAWYEDFMHNWERALNHYLESGTLLQSRDQ